MIKNKTVETCPCQPNHMEKYFENIIITFLTLIPVKDLEYGIRLVYSCLWMLNEKFAKDVFPCFIMGDSL